MNLESLISNPTVVCVYWAAVLVLLLIVLWYLRRSAENLGEFATALTDQDLHFRKAEHMGEFGTELTDLDHHYRGSANVEEMRAYQRIAPNVDPQEDEFVQLLW